MSFDEWYKVYSVGADFEPESATAEWADSDLKEAYEAGRQSQLGSFISVKLAAENEKVAREQGRQAGLERACDIATGISIGHILSSDDLSEAIRKELE